MNNTYPQIESRRIDIRAVTAVSVQMKIGDTIRCVRGQIWLTQQDDWRDYCLVEGVSFCADRDGKAVLCAVGGDGAARVERRAAGARMAPGSLKIDSIEAITRRARLAQAEWVAGVLARAGAWCRARIRALLNAQVVDSSCTRTH